MKPEYAQRRLNKTECMELLLYALRSGVMAFDTDTAEIRFGGLRYGTFRENWHTRVVEMIGRDRIEMAIEKKAVQ